MSRRRETSPRDEQEERRQAYLRQVEASMDLMRRVRTGDTDAARDLASWMLADRFARRHEAIADATLQLLVEEGDVKAMTQLGKLYRDWGQYKYSGGQTYAAKGADLLEAAAEANDPEACYTLADIRMDESKAEPKKEPKLALRQEAAGLYERAAEQEHPRACFELAKMYVDGKTIPQDLGKAYRLIHAAKLLFARDDIYFDPKEIAEVEAVILRDPGTRSMLQKSFAKGASQLGVQATLALPAPQGGVGKQGPARDL